MNMCTSKLKAQYHLESLKKKREREKETLKCEFNKHAQELCAANYATLMEKNQRCK